MKRKKTWCEKLQDSKDLPKIVKYDKKKPKQWKPGTYIIPAPKEVDEIMKKVPKGKVITINEIRKILAKRHKAQFGCPITIGIFSWIAAHAAAEAEAEGKKRITPYWRTLKTDGELNPKYPGGIDNIKHRLEAEGHAVVQKGRSKRLVVSDYEEALAKL